MLKRIYLNQKRSNRSFPFTKAGFQADPAFYFMNRTMQ
ncbi:hypothetical protein KIS1582_4164 [Cytobacillus firmus]|uniref:Uncharacterized protein n=1 Tax=Cytobacillus firmus TaxID=1399 RepID=A0A800N8T0_CYTFI|nr:hypothetical protein KIS1582_4164 [Cytobacillus firmus]